MKVSHVVPGLEMPAGGIENILWNLIPRLNEKGIETHIVSMRGDGELRDVFVDCGATVTTVEKSSTVDVRAVKAVINQLATSDADLVHLHFRWIPLRLALYYLVDIPLVVTYHNVYDPDVRASSRGRQLKMRLENRLNTLYDFSIFVSEAVKRSHHPKTVPENSRVIYAGIDFSELATGDDSGKTLRQTYGLSERQAIVGALGRFVPQKGFTELLRAFAAVADRTEAELVLGGDGEQQDELESLASRLDVADRVHFVGYVDDQYEFYAMSDIFVVPSRFEGLPVTLIEVCATGTPVVASDIAPLREVLGETPAPLVEPGDVDGFAEAILAMLNDATFRNDVGNSVQVTARSMFDIDSMVQDHVAVYESLQTISTTE